MGRFNHLEIGDWEPEQTVSVEESPQLDAYYYLEQANIAFADESYRRALSYYSRAVDDNQELEEAWLGELRSFIELHELDQAAKCSDRALGKFPNSAQLLAARGVIESRLGRSGTAIQYSDGAMSLEECTPYVWVARGEVLIPINAANAEACFAKAIAMAPDDWTVRSSIARAYILRQCHHQAVTHLRRALKLEQNRYTCWYWLGVCLEALGDYNEAKRALGRSLAAKPGFTKAREAIERIENKGIFSRIGAGLRRLFKGRQTSGGL